MSSQKETSHQSGIVQLSANASAASSPLSSGTLSPSPVTTPSVNSSVTTNSLASALPGISPASTLTPSAQLAAASPAQKTEMIQRYYQQLTYGLQLLSTHLANPSTPPDRLPYLQQKQKDVRDQLELFKQKYVKSGLLPAHWEQQAMRPVTSAKPTTTGSVAPGSSQVDGSSMMNASKSSSSLPNAGTNTLGASAMPTYAPRASVESSAHPRPALVSANASYPAHIGPKTQPMPSFAGMTTMGQTMPNAGAMNVTTPMPVALSSGSSSSSASAVSTPTSSLSSSSASVLGSASTSGLSALPSSSTTSSATPCSSSTFQRPHVLDPRTASSLVATVSTPVTTNSKSMAFRPLSGVLSAPTTSIHSSHTPSTGTTMQQTATGHYHPVAGTPGRPPAAMLASGTGLQSSTGSLPMQASSQGMNAHNQIQQRPLGLPSATGTVQPRMGLRPVSLQNASGADISMHGNSQGSTSNATSGSIQTRPMAATAGSQTPRPVNVIQKASPPTSVVPGSTTGAAGAAVASSGLSGNATGPAAAHPSVNKAAAPVSGQLRFRPPMNATSPHPSPFLNLSSMSMNGLPNNAAMSSAHHQSHPHPQLGHPHLHAQHQQQQQQIHHQQQQQQQHQQAMFQRVQQQTMAHPHMPPHNVGMTVSSSPFHGQQQSPVPQSVSLSQQQQLQLQANQTHGIPSQQQRHGSVTHGMHYGQPSVPSASSHDGSMMRPPGSYLVRPPGASIGGAQHSTAGPHPAQTFHYGTGSGVMSSYPHPGGAPMGASYVGPVVSNAMPSAHAPMGNAVRHQSMLGGPGQVRPPTTVHANASPSPNLSYSHHQGSVLTAAGQQHHAVSPMPFRAVGATSSTSTSSSSPFSGGHVGGTTGSHAGAGSAMQQHHLLHGGLPHHVSFSTLSSSTVSSQAPSRRSESPALSSDLLSSHNTSGTSGFSGNADTASGGKAKPKKLTNGKKRKKGSSPTLSSGQIAVSSTPGASMSRNAAHPGRSGPLSNAGLTGMMSSHHLSSSPWIADDRHLGAKGLVLHPSSLISSSLPFSTASIMPYRPLSALNAKSVNIGGPFGAMSSSSMKDTSIWKKITGKDESSLGKDIKEKCAQQGDAWLHQVAFYTCLAAYARKRVVTAGLGNSSSTAIPGGVSSMSMKKKKKSLVKQHESCVKVSPTMPTAPLSNDNHGMVQYGDLSYVLQRFFGHEWHPLPPLSLLESLLPTQPESSLTSSTSLSGGRTSSSATGGATQVDDAARAARYVYSHYRRRRFPNLPVKSLHAARHPFLKLKKSSASLLIPKTLVQEWIPDNDDSEKMVLMEKYLPLFHPKKQPHSKASKWNDGMKRDAMRKVNLMRELSLSSFARLPMESLPSTKAATAISYASASLQKHPLSKHAKDWLTHSSLQTLSSFHSVATIAPGAASAAGSKKRKKTAMSLNSEPFAKDAVLGVTAEGEGEGSKKKGKKKTAKQDDDSCTMKRSRKSRKSSVSSTMEEASAAMKAGGEYASPLDVLLPSRMMDEDVEDADSFSSYFTPMENEWNGQKGKAAHPHNSGYDAGLTSLFAPAGQHVDGDSSHTEGNLPSSSEWWLPLDDPKSSSMNVIDPSMASTSLFSIHDPASSGSNPGRSSSLIDQLDDLFMEMNPTS